MGLIQKTWRRCWSIGHHGRTPIPMAKSKSCREKGRVAPGGCFSVYVGPEKERFVIKTEQANHPLFKMLLDEAEMEYGYTSEGPLELPCDVEHFRGILSEMDQDVIAWPRRSLTTKGYAGYRLLSPSRVAIISGY